MTPLSYHDFSVSGPSSQQGSGIPLKLLCCFHQFLFIEKNKKTKKPFSRQSVIKVPKSISHITQPQNTSHNFHMAWHVILCSIDYIDVPTKESNKHAPGRVVIYISVHLVLIYTSAFSNVSLVLALNIKLLYSPEKLCHNRICCPSNRSKQVQETHTAYIADTQYTRQSLNEKQHTWLHRQCHEWHVAEKVNQSTMVEVIAMQEGH